MFDELSDGESIELSVPIALDDKGYLDRRCPSSECGVDFKVHYDDWLSLVKDEAAYCPVCGHAHDAQDFSTPEQYQYFGDMAMQHAMRIFDESMVYQARSFNARPQSGFVRLSVSYEPGAPLLVVPCEATELFRQDISCEQCSCRFATTGAAYFCPACQHNSSSAEYESSVENIERILDTLEQLTAAMRAQHDEDAAENLRRSLLENTLEDLATVLQRRTERLFASLANEASFPRDDNLFQRLSDASDLWKQATGTSYEDLLDAQEWAALNTMTERRHKIGHKQSHVDQRYRDKSGDSTYQVGQRLVISKEQVRAYLSAVRKLVDGLEKLV